MSKTLKMTLLTIVFTLGILFLLGMEVNAANISNSDELKEYFTNMDVKVEEKVITLNGDVELGEDCPVLKGEEYVLDLNGHTLTSNELVIDEATLTIKDSAENGKITAYIVAKEKSELNITGGIFENGIENHGALNVEGGKLSDIINVGTTVIKNGTVEFGIFNEQEGILTVENGKIGFVNQMGTLIVKGGVFSSEFTTLFISSAAKKTIISGGEFKTTAIEETEDLGEEKGAIVIEKANWNSEMAILDIFEVGYEPQYDSYTQEHYEGGDGNYYYNGYYGPSVKVVKQTENYSDIFKKITESEVWEINAFKPKTADDSDFLLTAIVEDLIAGTDYVAYGMCDREKFNPEEAMIYVYNKDGENSEQHRVKVKYIEPSADSVSKVNAVLNEMKNFTMEDMTEENGYRLEDLYLINYLNSKKGEFEGAKALNFAKDLIEATNGSNISYKFDARAGGADGSELYTFSMGQAIVYYNGVAYATKNAALTASHVLYIPSSTANTDKAYIEAALKRIKDYLGTTEGIKIEVGGTLKSLNYYDEYAGREITFNEFGLIDEKTAGSNYYNVTINGTTYRFCICKKDESKLETPKYIGCDITSNISITSNETTIPLDTALTVKKVTSEKIETALGTSTYAAYNISLYSNTKQENITKLENGEFEVKLPIPENLKSKKLTVYYVTDSGEKEEYTATVEHEFISFKTNHFSTYVLAEKIAENPTQVGEGDADKIREDKTEENKGEKDDTPNTGSVDIINYVIVVTVIAGIGIILLRKKN